MKNGLHSLYLSTGSNMGPSKIVLTKANQLIEKHIGRIKSKSSLYKTAAWGNTNQPDFINQVLYVQTVFTPMLVLKKIELIEREMGRLRIEKWGPRIIDIDILLYDNEVFESPKLRIPHPEMLRRNFVMNPLKEIAPYLIFPQTKLRIIDLEKKTSDNSLIIKLS